ncbi:foldase protein PrsA [Melghirimyces thermohalophilus]|uniref:Foldase protein PrsA n=1 Tax=Melghirimyces thermohalophilus TaxID=1236220 RepID=A0A1G6Q3G8_9BACL|nr:peptidylprolyl isomerase [Melghirimyces thermohalophilus]SDC86175.1 foldase protein PrsA [Melghirimyces thermohalophilus]
MQPIKKRLLTLLSALTAISLLVAGCGSGGEDGNAKDSTNPNGQAKPLPTDSKKVVAEYDGGKVTEGELNLYLNIFRFFQPQMAALVNSPEAKKKIVEQYIAEQMIVKRVKDDEKYTKEADKSLKQFEEQLKNMPQGKEKETKQQDMDSLLKENGITESDLKTFLINNNKVSAYFENKVKESDLKKKYEDSEDFYTIDLQHVLISTQEDPEGKKKKRSDKEAKALAEKVKKQLEEGKKFSDVAKKYSDDPGSKDKGGKIEGTPDQWAPEFGKAAKTLPLKKISDPIKTEFGYHVLKVNERKKQPFDKVKEQMKQEEIQKMYQDFIKEEVKVKKMDIPGDKENDEKEK